MAQHSVTIPITKSSYVDKANKFYSPSLTASLYNGGMPSYEDPEYFPVLGWNGLSVPPRKKMIEIVLHIYLHSGAEHAVTGSGQGWYIIPLKSTWDESTVNENILTYGPTWWDNHTFAKAGWNAIDLISFASDMDHFINHGDKGIALKTRHLYNGYMQYYSSRAANEYKPYISVVYEDAPPKKPIIISPISSYEANNEVIRFEWQYVSEVGGDQKKFDLEWKQPEDNDWTVISQVTANEYYDAAAETFPSGIIIFRLKTYNEHDEASEYSEEVMFYSVGAPSAPVILSVEDKSRPVVAWTAPQQQVYQLRVLTFPDGDLIYDSESIPSLTAQSHKVKKFLPPGEYIAQVRVQNEYGLYSPWGQAGFVVTDVSATQPQIIIYSHRFGQIVKITNYDDAKRYLLYRAESDKDDCDKDDFICIAESEGDTAYDYSAESGKEYKYFIRAVDESEAFADSEIRYAVTRLHSVCLGLASNLADQIELKATLNDMPSREHNWDVGGTQVFYSGREYPVTEYDEHTERRVENCLFHLKTRNEVERLIAIYKARQVVLYRDARGTKLYGSMGKLNIKEDAFGYVVSFSLSQVDFSEEVEFDD